MKNLTYIGKCVFLIDNVYIYKEITKSREYDETIPGAEKDAQKEIELQIKNLPNLSFMLGESVSLYGGRVNLQYGDSHYRGYYIYVDGIDIINSLSEYMSPDYKFSIGIAEMSKVIQILNDISIYGADDFLANYKSTFEEFYANCKSIMEESDVESLKKNFKYLLITRYYLERWRPLGKSNKDMNELDNRLEYIIEKVQNSIIELSSLTSANLKTPIEIKPGENLIVDGINLNGWQGHEGDLHKAIAILNNALNEVNHSLNKYDDEILKSGILDYLSTSVKTILQNCCFIETNGNVNIQLAVAVYKKTFSDDLAEYIFDNRIDDRPLLLHTHIKNIEKSSIDKNLNREICN